MKNTVFKAALSLVFLLASNLILAQNESNELKNAYDFDYIYKLKMTNKKDDIQFDYYLKKDAGYFGFDLPTMSKDQKDMSMFTVIDNDNGVTAMFMEMMGKKMVRKSKIKLSDFASENEDTDFTFKKIESKTILGYQCEGYIMENKESEIKVYITNEAPVSFNKMWNNGKNKMPKGFNASWLEKYAENGLLMEMQYVDKKKSKNNVTMTCVGVEKTEFSIETSNYGSMLGALGN